MNLYYKELNSATDAAGILIHVGSVCIFLGRFDHDDSDYRGRRVIIRAISDSQHTADNTFMRGPRKGQFKAGSHGSTIQARVDDAVGSPDELDDFHWSAWVDVTTLAAITEASVSR